jgi:hypothetical protein
MISVYREDQEDTVLQEAPVIAGTGYEACIMNFLRGHELLLRSHEKNH